MNLNLILKNRSGLLGINERNLSYIRKYNSPSAKHIADDKIVTKKVLKSAHIPCTETIAIICNTGDLQKFDFDILPKSFVLKPSQGVAGGGIEIFYNRDRNGYFIRGDGSRFSLDQVKAHIQHIIWGRFSHQYKPDCTIIEERVKPYNQFRPYTYKGTPDIRILLFRQVPVMAMVRWPTKESNGKANLSEGAAASGIDLATGITTHSVKETKSRGIIDIEYVPETRIRYAGIKIPQWNFILQSALKAASIAELGYCAVDFLIDREKGPLIVELNSRPGLRIQLVNQDGLRWRLQQVKKLKIKSDTHAIRLGKDLFGGEIEEEIEAIVGKKIIGLIQKVTLFHKTKRDTSITIKAKIDTGATFSSIDTTLAKDLGYSHVVHAFESFKIPETMTSKEEALKWQNKLHTKLKGPIEDVIGTHVIKNSNGFSFRVAILVKCQIDDKIIDAEVNIRNREELLYSMILGKKDLSSFLIDPTK